MPLPKNYHTKGFQTGLAMRKKVLGADYVERAIANADDLGMPFQEVATEMAWGKVWTRPGLDLPTRSLVTLAMCIALNRPNEIKIHLRGAIRNGVSRTQLRELLLHSFLYCGGPAALDACAVVRAALPEIEAAERAEKAAKAPRKAAAKKPVKNTAKAPAKKTRAAAKK
jgi:4-carboxymuconolactone decarboxylase